MTERRQDEWTAGGQSLALTVGCSFGLHTVAPTASIVQVAPRLQRGASINSERWDTTAHHHGYVDQYGNRCERFELQTGPSQITYEAQVVLTQPSDLVEPAAREIPVARLPHEVLNFVMPSRFCLPDELGHEAWQRFGGLEPGWSRVQAVVDYVHGHLEFLPGASNPWTTAADAYRAGQGVCRDFAHLAITFCRALNIPARYVFGYLPDIGVPPAADPMDFAASMEVFLGGAWWPFDPRNNQRRVGRALIARGRDALDVAMVSTYGGPILESMTVWADELTD